ncbi:hypothetical protein L1887_58477 [Cichorium endivia]|nr:hypothetical protein L1887_58477 [Cichorium endivia]
MQYHQAGVPIHLNVNAPPGPRAMRPGPNMPNTEARLYVGSLHFSLTDENVKAVFEPFGEIEYVDLHREPGTGKSKGFCFIQFKHADDARKAHEAMNGFELAGRAIRVGNVNAKGSGSSFMGGPGPNSQSGGHLPQLTSAFDDGGGAGLNPERRAALMQKLARNNEPSPAASDANTATQERPAGIPEATSTSLLLKNMFDPAEETEADWDKDLAEDVKDECQAKYGPVTRIHVEKESAGEIYLTFADLDASRKALDGLNGRFFGGKPISAQLSSVKRSLCPLRLGWALTARCAHGFVTRTTESNDKKTATKTKFEAVLLIASWIGDSKQLLQRGLGLARKIWLACIRPGSLILAFSLLPRCLLLAPTGATPLETDRTCASSQSRIGRRL